MNSSATTASRCGTTSRRRARSSFWLAAVNIYTGERIRYPVAREQWSVHFNVSWSGKIFSGDGAGPDGVANMTPLPEAKTLNPPVNNKWIYLFTPIAGKFDTIKVGGEDVKVGKFTVEKLFNMAPHDYSKRTGVEPNLMFTPDDKWLVFRSKNAGQRAAGLRRRGSRRRKK